MKKLLLLVLVILPIHGLKVTTWDRLGQAGLYSGAIGGAVGFGGGIGWAALAVAMRKAHARNDDATVYKLNAIKQWSKRALAAGMGVAAVSGILYWLVQKWMGKAVRKLLLKEPMKRDIPYLPISSNKITLDVYKRLMKYYVESEQILQKSFHSQAYEQMTEIWHRMRSRDLRRAFILRWRKRAGRIKNVVPGTGQNPQPIMVELEHQTVNNTSSYFCVAHAYMSLLTGQFFMGAPFLYWLSHYTDFSESNIESLFSLAGNGSFFDKAVAAVMGRRIFRWFWLKNNKSNKLMLNRIYHSCFGFSYLPEYDMHLLRVKALNIFPHREYFNLVSVDGKAVDRVVLNKQILQDRIDLMAQMFAVMDPLYWEAISNDIWMFMSLYILSEATVRGHMYKNQAMGALYNSLGGFSECDALVQQVLGIIKDRLEREAAKGCLSQQMVDDLLLKHESGSYKWLSVLPDNGVSFLAKSLPGIVVTGRPEPIQQPSLVEPFAG